MDAMWIQSKRAVLVGLLGATVLFGSPLYAQADQGKWWNPERGARDQRGDRGNSGERGDRGDRVDRGNSGDRGDRGSWGDRGVRRSTGWRESYRAPAWSSRGAYRQGPRYWRPWDGRRIYRERTWLRAGWGYDRPVYGWRYYCAPSYYYPRHIIYVRPVRFFISARIGGVHVHAGNYGYDDDSDIYGCNFCDAQFSSFDSYERHMAHCPYAPRGYRVIVSDWDHGQWSDDQWQDDRGWDREDDD
jgi:hypothetical protein